MGISQLCSVVGAKIFSCLIVLVSALCSTHATGLSQKIDDVHLHAKLGEGLPESVPLTDTLDLVDRHATIVAQKVVKRQIPNHSFLYEVKYGPIDNVVLPGVKLPRPINLTKIVLTAPKGLKLNDLKWRMASNRVMCNATIPSLLVDVNFDNVQIELDENFGDKEFFTNLRLSVRFMGLEMYASARYNIKGEVTNPDVFIDKAEVDIKAKEIMFELKVVQRLEEVRYVLSELFNNSLEDIMDAVLKVVVNEINKELLKVDPKKVTDYLIWRVAKSSKVPKELIAINRV